jgi:hypothetical protein
MYNRWFIILILLIIAGCDNNINEMDISGKIELHRSMEGWPIKSIDSKRYIQEKFPWDNKISILQENLKFESPAKIGGREYTFSTSSDLLKVNIFDKSVEKKIRVKVEKRVESGDSWNSHFFKNKNSKNFRNGYCIQSFIEPTTNTTAQLAP